MSFKRLEPEDLVISAEPISGPAWSTGNIALNTFFTSSAQETANGVSFLDVYQSDPSSADDAEVQFSLAFCHKDGSGSLRLTDEVSGSTYSSINYGTYRSIVLGDEDSDFKFDGTTPVRYFYALSIERERYREEIIPGTFELTVNSTTVITPVVGTTKQFTGGGIQYYNLKSGADEDYGWLLPAIGTVILNGPKLDTAISLNTSLSYLNVDQKNAVKLLDELTTIKCQYRQTITSNFAFIRTRNAEFNYTTNPTYIDEDGDLLITDFISDPKTYITTVGLYNDNNDLLAVAKLSKPLVKDFRKEALVRIKLDF